MTHSHPHSTAPDDRARARPASRPNGCGQPINIGWVGADDFYLGSGPRIARVDVPLHSWIDASRREPLHRESDLEDLSP